MPRTCSRARPFRRRTMSRQKRRSSRRRTTCARRKRRSMRRETSSRFSVSATRRSRPSSKRARLIRTPRCFRPIPGTVVQRKVGPGQYINSGASDPVYVIGDLSEVWLVAFVRETDAGIVSVGQDVSFTVLSLHRIHSRRTLTTLLPRSIRTQEGCSSAPPSITKKGC